MAEEDQEQFANYQALEHFIEELQAGHAAQLPAELTTEQSHIYQMAALFYSAAPNDISEPRPAFVEELHARIEQELQLQQEQKSQQFKHIPLADKKQQQGGQRGKASNESRNTTRPVSRRALLAGGAAVAASLVAGAAIENGSSHRGENQAATSQQWNQQLLATSQPTTWLFVTTLAELGDTVVRFATDTLVGYVVRNDSANNNQGAGTVIAMSAACTHMGCLVQWQASEHTFLCPCHGGLFTEYGEPNPKSPLRYLTPLPRLNTKVENGKVYVEVPAGTR